MTDQNDQQPENEPREPQPTPVGEKPAEDQPAHADAQKTPRLPIFKLSWQFAAGFVGWFLVNGLIWFLVLGNYFDQLFLLIFPLNLGVLIILSRNRATRQIAGGILTAWGVNLLFSLVLGFVENAVCLIPFFLSGGR